jgi:DNA-binding FadR family transcriptional regulator
VITELLIMSVRPVRNLSLADQVFQQLASAIVSSHYLPGQALPAERKLVETFQVNRHVVREALKRLEQIGMVRITQGGGTRVLDFKRHAGLDLLALMADYSTADSDAMVIWLAVHEMRAVIAADAARLCAIRATPELKRELGEISQKMLAIGDGPEIFTLELHFWDRVIEGSGNIAYRLAFNSLIQGTHAPSVKEIAGIWAVFEAKQSGFHADLVQAIQEGQSERAETSARTVVRAVNEALSRALASKPAVRKDESERPAAGGHELRAATGRRQGLKRAAKVSD